MADNNAFRNLAKELSKERLEEIGEEIKEGFEKDFSSMQEYRDIITEIDRLNVMKREPKNEPWEGCANIKLPIISTPVANYTARTMLNMFGQPNFLRVISLENKMDSQEVAQIMSRFLNFQLKLRQPDYIDGFERSINHQATYGTYIRKQFYDQQRKMVVSAPVLPENFVVSYSTKELEKSERYSQILKITMDVINKRAEKGYYINTEELNTPNLGKEEEVTRNSKESFGQTETTSDFTTPLDIIESHVMMKLNKKDKLARPLIVTFDRETNNVMRIVSRENPTDKNADPLCFFTACSMFDSTKNFYGMGFGHLLVNIAHAVNTLMNMSLDSMSLAIQQGGIVAANSSMPRGTIKVKPGEYLFMNMRTDDIRKSILPHNFQPPSTILISLLDHLKRYVDEFTTVTQLFTGGTDSIRSDLAATSSALAVEQGAKLFTSLQMKNHRALTREYENIKTLNSIFGPKEIIVPDLDNLGEAYTLQKSDFKRDFLVVPAADPNVISTQQLIGKAEYLKQAVMESPFLAEDPNANLIQLRKRLEAVQMDDETIRQLEGIFAQVFKQQQQATQQGQNLSDAMEAAKREGGGQPEQEQAPPEAQQQ